MTEGSRFLEELILDDDPRTLLYPDLGRDPIQLPEPQVYSGALRGDGRMASLHSEEVDPHYVFDITEEGASLTVHIPDDAKSDDTFHIITEVQNVTETPFKNLCASYSHGQINLDELDYCS